MLSITFHPPHRPLKERPRYFDCWLQASRFREAVLDITMAVSLHPILKLQLSIAYPHLHVRREESNSWSNGDIDCHRMFEAGIVLRKKMDF